MLLLALSMLAHAIPTSLQHQGRLFDTVGAPLGGTQQLTFTLYDGATGGTAVWSDTQNVTFDNGYFSAYLGATVGNPLDDSILANDNLHITLTFATTETARQPLNAVPYARLAAHALTADEVLGASLAGLSCLPNQTPLYDGADWGCADPPSGTGNTVAWTDLTGVPADLLDGDDADTLGALTCAEGHVARWQTGSWVCDSVIDTDTTLTEQEVEDFVTNGAIDLAASTTLAGQTLVTTATDMDTQLSESEVEAFVTNGALDLNAGTTIGGQPILTSDTTLTDAEVDAFVMNGPLNFAAGTQLDGTDIALVDDPRFVSQTCTAAQKLSWDGGSWSCAPIFPDDSVLTTCSTAGTVRWNASGLELEVCDGTDWLQVRTSGSCVPGKTILSHTGAHESFIVPDGCNTLTVSAWGAGGGGGYSVYEGSPGGFIEGTLTVTPGETLTVVVGQGGQRNGAGSGGALGPAAYGFGGNPQSGGSTCAVGGGGGLSGIFRGAPSQANALLIAGGGGGASGHAWPGMGGDPATAGGHTAGLAGMDGDSVWEGGGGGGYTGGTLQCRDGDSCTWMAADGGENYAVAGATNVTSDFQATTHSRVPPQIVHQDYAGSGTSGNAAIGYGGRTGSYGQYCDDAGDGAVVISWSQE